MFSFIKYSTEYHNDMANQEIWILCTFPMKTTCTAKNQPFPADIRKLQCALFHNGRAATHTRTFLSSEKDRRKLKPGTKRHSTFSHALNVHINNQLHDCSHEYEYILSRLWAKTKLVYHHRHPFIRTNCIFLATFSGRAESNKAHNERACDMPS